jgi:two-component system alkaline phosphatase synthesis response regulator PhoP
MATKILVVDDEPWVVQAVRSYLEEAHFEVISAHDGAEALAQFDAHEPDLIVLDWMLPKLDGISVAQRIRQTSNVPIIMLTARADEEARIEGLETGADDYVVKPFSLKELLARIDAVLRRSPERPTDVTEVPIPAGRADLARREVHLDSGERVALSQREAELLRYLACNAGRAVSRDEILSRVWRINPSGIDTRTIDMHVARLREKLRDDSAHPRVLLTVRGKGYMFAGPGEAP